MAITFTKSLPEDELLASHNNNIVEFSSNSALTSVSAVINLGSVAITVTPNPNGLFHFNFIEAVKVLINENKFKDMITPDFENTGYIYNDNTLYKKIVTTFKVVYEGGTFEQITKTYCFIKSVRQAQKYERRKIKIDFLALLIPYDFSSNSNKTYYAIYYSGMPFDIPIFSNVTRTITIKNVTNSFTETLDLTEGVNRFFLSQGDRSITNDDFLPLHDGINELEFQITPTNFVTLFLEKRREKCSPLLKLYNNQGGYSYLKAYRNHTQEKQTKTINSISSNLKDISETNQTEFITGKESKNKTTLIIKVNERQLNYLAGIIDSPRVELFQELLGQKQDSDSFYGVTVSDGSYKLVDTKKRIYELVIKIGFEINTLGF